MEKLLVLLSAVIASLLPTGFAIRCYVCSWSPDDANNRTDLCSDENFSHRNAPLVDCDLGCETYTQWDGNDALEHWRRNCIQGDTVMSGDCVPGNNLFFKSIRCTCDTDFCNSATSLCLISPLFQVIVFGISLSCTVLLQTVII